MGPMGRNGNGRYYVVNVCRTCGEQQWYAGTCGDCGGRVESFPALLKKDIEEHADLVSEASSPVPRHFIEHFVDSLFRRSSAQRSG
jgi:hypothetical protein